MEGVRKFVAWIMANHPDARRDQARVRRRQLCHPAQPLAWPVG
jgi:hypothetical protein